MTDDALFAHLLEQEELERVAPKLEIFKQPMRIKGCRGGRGAGAKSWSLTSLIVQRAQYVKTRIICLREFQKSLEESAYIVFQNTIERLRYNGWKLTNEYINSPCGSHIIFRGLKDYHSVSQAKGLEDFDIFFAEEASALSMRSLDILLPTIVRKDGAEFWFCYNPEADPDPVTEKIWNRNRDDAILVELEPGKKDNPWWNEGLQHEMELDFAYDPYLAAHTWLGEPLDQGAQAVMSRVAVEAAMRRNITEPIGVIECGVDVARFGNDRSVGYKRHGLKIIDSFCVQGFDTNQVAYKVWDLAGHRPDVLIKIDAGYNPGVIDRVREMGGKVAEVNFGGSAMDKQRYKMCVDEMWFEFPVNEADIPNDPELKRELCSRLYDYEKNTGRKLVESKADYKKRLMTPRSPDLADALLLTFYQGGKIIIDETNRKALAERRREG